MQVRWVGRMLQVACEHDPALNHDRLIGQMVSLGGFGFQHGRLWKMFMCVARQDSAEDFSRLNAPALHSYGLDFHSHVLLCRSMTG